MSEPQSITSVAESPDDDRKRRMVRYTVAMVVRVICLILGMVTQGLWMWVFFAGAIFLPYFAVVIANAQGGGKNTKSGTVPVAPTISIPASAFTVVDSSQGPEQASDKA